MNMRERTKLESFSMRELRGIILDVAEALWPEGDPDHEWDSETIEDVARVLENCDLQPVTKAKKASRRA